MKRYIEGSCFLNSDNKNDAGVNDIRERNSIDKIARSCSCCEVDCSGNKIENTPVVKGINVKSNIESAIGQDIWICRISNDTTEDVIYPVGTNEELTRENECHQVCTISCSENIQMNRRSLAGKYPSITNGTSLKRLCADKCSTKSRSKQTGGHSDNRKTNTNQTRPSLTLAFNLFTALQLLTSAVSAHEHRGLDMCEPIEIPMCAGMRYNMTRMPNHLHHSTQENARLAIEPYGELVKQNCSADILFFLCAMFAPICTPHFQKEAIPPCRSVCERSRRGCEPLMNKYNFSWPDDLDCNRLPEYDKGVCVSPEAIVSSMPEENTTDTKDEKQRHKPKQDCKCTNRNKPNKNVYKAGKFNYAIGALVKSITHINETASVVRVLVNSILQRGKVHIQEKRLMHLWAESDCVCPALRANREYLIIGHEEVMLNRLKFTNDSLISRWQPKWGKKFKRWTKQKRRRGKDSNRSGKRIRCKNPKSKSCKKKKKSRVRCRVEQKDESKTTIKCTRPKGNSSKNKNKNNRRKNSLKKKNTDNDTSKITKVTNKAGR